MMYRRFLFTLLAAAGLVLAGSSARADGLGPGQAAPAQDAPTQADKRIAAEVATTLYMPIIYGKNIEISGLVTDNNAVAAGQIIKVLQSTDGGGSYHQVSQLTTDSAGRYVFYVPIMAPSHRYQLLWSNPNPKQYTNWLNYFLCNDVLPTTPSGTCDINIRDIKMVKPNVGATVNWPITFQWAMRSSTSDDYKVRIYKSDQTLHMETPYLGYTDRVTMPTAPPGTATNVLYYWSMYVKTPYGEGDALFLRSIYWRDLSGPPLHSSVLESWQSIEDGTTPDAQKLLEP